MLKIIGSVLIIVVSTIYGYQRKESLFEHVRQLIGFKEILLMLIGEISYTRTPLQEAFLHIASQGKEPYGSFLTLVSESMECREGKTLSQIWAEAFKKQEKEFLLSKEEKMILKNVGENLGYLDVKMQISNINLYIQQIEVKIVQAQQQLEAKQKMYQYLSIMSGLFLILILI